MVAIIKRMRVLREILNVRVGPGALVLPKDVSKLSMEFNYKIVGGQFRGARKFWREMLPRIKYRNPAVPVEISRHQNATGPALLHIYRNSPESTSTSSTTTTPPSTEPQQQSEQIKHTIDIKNKTESEILEALVATTQPTLVEPTQQELEQLEDVRAYKERAEKDRVEVREKLLRERREQELLKMARGEK